MNRRNSLSVAPRQIVRLSRSTCSRDIEEEFNGVISRRGFAGVATAFVGVAAAASNPISTAVFFVVVVGSLILFLSSRRQGAAPDPFQRATDPPPPLPAGGTYERNRRGIAPPATPSFSSVRRPPLRSRNRRAPYSPCCPFHPPPRKTAPASGYRPPAGADIGSY